MPRRVVPWATAQSERPDCGSAPLPRRCQTAAAAQGARCQVLSTAARRWQAESLRELPFACVRAAIYVQYFTSGEGGVYQEQNCIYDFFDFTHSADGVQPLEKLMGLGFVHRSIDGA